MPNLEDNFAKGYNNTCGTLIISRIGMDADGSAMKVSLSSFKKRLASVSPESLALWFVWFFFTIGFIATFGSITREAIDLAAASRPWPYIIRQSMFTAFIGFGATIIITPFLGGLCASFFMRRTVREACPASLVKRDFALADDDMLMGFIRQHKVSVYRTKSRLPDTVVDNVPAMLEPLFSLCIYFPLLPSALIGAGKICFEREDIESIKKRTLDSLVAAMPEMIQNVYDKEKGAQIESLQAQLQEAESTARTQIQELKDTSQARIQELQDAAQVNLKECKELSHITIQELKHAVEEKNREITLLQEQLQSCKSSAREQMEKLEESSREQLREIKESSLAQLQDVERSWRARLQEMQEAADSERRDLKKRHTQAEKRVNEHLLLGYVGMRLVSHFHKARYGTESISRFQATKGNITEAITNLLHEEPQLRTQLNRWQRSDKGEQDDVFYDLLRLAMPTQLVNWGGHSMTFDAAVKKYFREGSPA